MKVVVIIEGIFILINTGLLLSLTGVTREIAKMLRFLFFGSDD